MNEWGRERERERERMSTCGVRDERRSLRQDQMSGCGDVIHNFGDVIHNFGDVMPSLIFERHLLPPCTFDCKQRLGISAAAAASFLLAGRAQPSAAAKTPQIYPPAPQAPVAAVAAAAAAAAAFVEVCEPVHGRPARPGPRRRRRVRVGGDGAGEPGEELVDSDGRHVAGRRAVRISNLELTRRAVRVRVAAAEAAGRIWIEDLLAFRVRETNSV